MRLFPALILSLCAICAWGIWLALEWVVGQGSVMVLRSTAKLPKNLLAGFGAISPWLPQSPFFLRICRPVNRAIHLSRVVGDEDVIDPCSQGFGGDFADAEAIHSAHVEVVGEDGAVVAPLFT